MEPVKRWVYAYREVDGCSYLGADGFITPCGTEMWKEAPDGEYVSAEDFAKLEAERDALARRVAWQPIETAPKDGELLGWFPFYAPAAVGGIVCVMRWYDDKHAKNPKPHWQGAGWVWGVRDQRKKQPTHWMPLPDPPVRAAGGDRG